MRFSPSCFGLDSWHSQNLSTRFILDSWCCRDLLTALLRPADRGFKMLIEPIWYYKTKLQKKYVIFFSPVHEVPFSSESKFQFSVHSLRSESQLLLVMKGAPEKIVERCSTIVLEHGEVEVSPSKIQPGAKPIKICSASIYSTMEITRCTHCDWLPRVM